MGLTYHLYIPPTSWTDKGMDWNNPRPQIDYFMALQSAKCERLSWAGYSEYPCVNPGQMIRYRALVDLYDEIDSTIRMTINPILPHDLMSDNLHDDPELFQFFNFPLPGTPPESIIPWMKAAKKILCKFSCAYQDEETFWEGSTPNRDYNNGNEHYTVIQMTNNTSDIMLFEIEPYSRNIYYGSSRVFPGESIEFWINQKYYSYTGKITAKYLRVVPWFRFT